MPFGYGFIRLVCERLRIHGSWIQLQGGTAIDEKLKKYRLQGFEFVCDNGNGDLSAADRDCRNDYKDSGFGDGLEMAMKDR